MKKLLLLLILTLTSSYANAGWFTSECGDGVKDYPIVFPSYQMKSAENAKVFICDLYERVQKVGETRGITSNIETIKFTKDPAKGGFMLTYTQDIPSTEFQDAQNIIERTVFKPYVVNNKMVGYYFYGRNIITNGVTTFDKASNNMQGQYILDTALLNLIENKALKYTKEQKKNILTSMN